MLGAGVADAKPERVELCHLNDANGMVYGGANNAIYLGRIIEVSEAAVSDHEAHGDSTEDELGDLGGLITPDSTTVSTWAPGGQWNSIMENAEAQDVKVTNANCAFRLDES